MFFALMLFTKFVLPFYDLVVCTMLLFLPILCIKFALTSFMTFMPFPYIKFALKGNVASCICYPILEALYHANRGTKGCCHEKGGKAGKLIY